MLTLLSRTRIATTLLCLAVTAGQARAQSQQQFAVDATRVMALGDSIAAGYEAMPVTSGYAYLLYQNGAFDRIPHTLFCNAAVPGASSRDVLLYQVPLALIAPAKGGFGAHYITLTVGGNDLLAILQFAATHPDQNEVLQFAQQVLGGYAQNLGQILVKLEQDCRTRRSSSRTSTPFRKSRTFSRSRTWSSTRSTRSWRRWSHSRPTRSSSMLTRPSSTKTACCSLSVPEPRSLKCI